MGAICSCFTPKQHDSESRNSEPFPRQSHPNQSHSRPYTAPPSQPSRRNTDEFNLPVHFKLGQSYPQRAILTRDDASSVFSAPSPTISSNPNGELLKVGIQWRSPIPLTRGQLERMRAEFWETSPAYGGTEEVWQALKNAVEVGQTDLDTARTILKCIGVTTPSGYMTECYDMKGYRYVIPNYCLADPIMGIKEMDEDDQRLGKIVPEIQQNSKATKKETLRLRISNGFDAEVLVPENISIGDLKGIVQTELKLPEHAAFFWCGHGPLSNETLLSSLPGFMLPNKMFLQVWLF